MHAQARPRVSRGGRGSCRASPPPRRACRSRCSASSMSRARRLSAAATDAPGRAPPPRATASPRNGPSVFIAPEVPRLRNARSRAYGSSAGTPPELSCVPLCALAASELAASWAARASSGTASASAVISATVDGRPSNFCSSGASGVSVPPSRLEMNSTVLCRLMICSCAARRRATVAAVASASPASTSSACKVVLRFTFRVAFVARIRRVGRERRVRRRVGPWDLSTRARARRRGERTCASRVVASSRRAHLSSRGASAARPARSISISTNASSLGHAESRVGFFRRRKRQSPERRKTRGDARGDELRNAPARCGR